MNTPKIRQKFTRNIKFAFTFLVLQFFIIGNSYAIQLTLNGHPDNNNLNPIEINGDIEYHYDFIYDHDGNAGTQDIQTRIMKISSDDPFLCLGPNTGMPPNIFFLDNYTTILTDDKVHGFVGIASVSYDYNPVPVTDKIINLQTDLNSECVVKGFNNIENPNPNPANPFVFIDSFETGGSSFPNESTYPDLKIELLDDSAMDMTLVGQNSNGIGGEIISSENPFTYKYKITNLGNTGIVFDIVDYFSHKGALTSWSCSEDKAMGSNTACGADSVKLDTDNYSGAVYLRDIIIENIGESVTVTVTRKATISTDTSIDLLVTALITNGVDQHPSSNSDTRVFTAVKDNIAPDAPDCSTDLVVANADTNVTTTCTSVESGATISIENMTCGSESGNEVVCTGTVGIEGTDDGRIYVSDDVVTITDSSGNSTPEDLNNLPVNVTRTGLTIDNVAPLPPVITNPEILGGNNGNDVIGNNTNVEGSCNEFGQICFEALGIDTGNNGLHGLNPTLQCFDLNAQSTMNFTGSLIWEMNADSQSYSLNSTCRDIADNESDPFSVPVFVDLESPGVSVEQKAGQADSTFANTIDFTIQFDEPIELSTFNILDINLQVTNGMNTSDGSALTKSLIQVAPFNGAVWELNLQGMTHADTVTAKISAGKVTDKADNPNEVSTSTDNSVTYQSALIEFSNDTTAPEESGTLPKLLVKGNVSAGTMVTISLGGNADIGNDYTLPSTTFEIPPMNYVNSTEVSIKDLTIVEDGTGFNGVVEGDQTIVFTLVSTFGDLTIGDADGLNGVDTELTHTIVNDDAMVLQIGSAASAENTMGQFPTLSLPITVVSGSTESEFMVSFTATGITAALNSDYLPATPSSPITIPAGFNPSTTVPVFIDVKIIGDDNVEETETFEVELSNPTLSGVTINPSVGTGTITNDDFYQVSGEVYYDENGDTVNANNATETGLQDVTVWLYEDTNMNQTFDSGTDTLVDTQVSATNGSYSFTDQVTLGDYLIVVNHADSALNNDANNGNITYGTTTAKVIAFNTNSNSMDLTGQDFGFDQVEVTLTSDKLEISEDPVETANIAASLSISTGFTTTVNLTYSGTATPPGQVDNDYTIIAGINANSTIQIIIPPDAPSNQLFGRVSVTSVMDMINDNSETIVIDIGSVDNAIEATPNQVTINIVE